MEEWLELLFKEQPVICRETFRRAAASCISSPYAFEDMAEEGAWSFKQALEVLRIWEYTGRARRGYFVEGMSGAQFVRREDYEAVTAALKVPGGEIIWLNASDPSQVWGKALNQTEGENFLNVPGTAVALRAGIPVAVLERQGKILRVFETEGLEAVFKEFSVGFRQKLLFPELKRLIVKEYPKEAAEALKAAGFLKEMQDYVLYR